MPDTWNNIVTFYRDCYAADNRDQIISNIFGIDEALRFVFEGSEELLSGAFTRVPLPDDLGQRLNDKSLQYFREKQLIYGTAFLAGRLPDVGQKLCAPLLFAFVELHKDNGHWYIQLTSDVQLNTPILKSLASEASDIDALEAQLDAVQFVEQKVATLYQWLTQNTDLQSDLGLLSYPKLCPPELLEKHSRSRSKIYGCTSAAVFLSDRPRSAQGVCHALEAIAKSPALSAPLRCLLQTEKNRQENTRAHSLQKHLPVLLSEAQQSTLNIAASQDLGVITGPPGTGKSFTIAAIIADRILCGEKVLVVSETEPALEVIVSKLASTFSITEGVVRAGRQNYLADLKQYLNDLIILGVPAVDEQEIDRLRTQVSALVKRESVLEWQYKRRSQRAMRRGAKLVKRQQQKHVSFISRWLTRWSDYRIASDTPMRDILEEIYDVNNQREQLAKQFIAKTKQFHIAQLLSHHRPELIKFNQAIRARTSLKQQQTFDSIDYSLLLQAFPVWLVSLASLYKVLPLKQDLFDLVIFDEASQCNIAAAMPALYRAKPALIVGDAKQLRHLSFLPKSKENKLRNIYGIEENAAPSYRSNSILDYAAEQLKSQSGFALLDEHYRSQPEIIDFSNQNFYTGRLKVMHFAPENATSQSLLFCQVAGNRDESGVNKVEAQAILKDIEKLINNERSKPARSIGVLSPFRKQAEYIEALIVQKIPQADIARHRILVGTPYHFQGEERDNMYLSFAICEGSKAAAGYLNNANMFNVAVTRAREKQIVYFSIKLGILNPNNLLARYLAHQYHTAKSPILPTKDHFLTQMIEALNSHSIETWPAYTVAHCELDILCHLNGNYVGVDLVGYPGQYESHYNLHVFKTFSRAGLRVVPIEYGVWQRDPEACLKDILSALKKAKEVC